MSRDAPSPDDAAARARALALIPRLLVALAGGCTVSGIGGLAWILAGFGAPHVGPLLVPPVAALLGTALWLTRRPGAR